MDVHEVAGYFRLRQKLPESGIMGRWIFFHGAIVTCSVDGSLCIAACQHNGLCSQTSASACKHPSSAHFNCQWGSDPDGVDNGQLFLSPQ